MDAKKWLQIKNIYYVPMRDGRWCSRSGLINFEVFDCWFMIKYPTFTKPFCKHSHVLTLNSGYVKGAATVQELTFCGTLDSQQEATN